MEKSTYIKIVQKYYVVPAIWYSTLVFHIQKQNPLFIIENFVYRLIWNMIISIFFFNSRIIWILISSIHPFSVVKLTVMVNKNGRRIIKQSYRKHWAWMETMAIHDDVIKWRHIPRYWPFVRGIHRSPVNSPHKGQWRGALMFLWSAPWINGWVNNRKAGDLRRHRAHYDVIVMCTRVLIQAWVMYLFRYIYLEYTPGIYAMNLLQNLSMQSNAEHAKSDHYILNIF